MKKDLLDARIKGIASDKLSGVELYDALLDLEASDRTITQPKSTPSLCHQSDFILSMYSAAASSSPSLAAIAGIGGKSGRFLPGALAQFAIP
jgi:hypothetical protein